MIKTLGFSQLTLPWARSGMHLHFLPPDININPNTAVFSLSCESVGPDFTALLGDELEGPATPRQHGTTLFSPPPAPLYVVLHASSLRLHQTLLTKPPSGPRSSSCITQEGDISGEDHTTRYLHVRTPDPHQETCACPPSSHASLGSWLSCPPEWLSHGCALCSALCHCLHHAKASSSVSEKIEALRGEPRLPPLTHSLPASAIFSQPTGPAPCGFSSPYSSCFSSFHASREPEPGSLSGSLSSVLQLHCFLTVLGRDQAPLCCRVTPPALPSTWSTLPLLSTCSSAWVPCLLRAFHPPNLKFSSPVFLSQPCWVPHCNLSCSEYFAWTLVYIIISFPIIL